MIKECVKITMENLLRRGYSEMQALGYVCYCYNMNANVVKNMLKVAA